MKLSIEFGRFELRMEAGLRGSSGKESILSVRPKAWEVDTEAWGVMPRQRTLDRPISIGAKREWEEVDCGVSERSHWTPLTPGWFFYKWGEKMSVVLRIGYWAFEFRVRKFKSKKTWDAAPSVPVSRTGFKTQGGIPRRPDQES